MLKFRTLLKRFRSDDRGNFAVIFGLLSVVLIATAGAVVDFSGVQQARTKAQDALDSAALGLQPSIFTTGVTIDTIKPKAQALVDERLADEPVTATVTTVAINKNDGMLRLTAELTVPTAFVSLVGVNSISAKVISEATRKRLNVEVGMVLDNSLSMSFDSPTRMTNLKLAAKCAMNILLNGVSDCLTATMTATTPLASSINSVKIGIVPFTEFVNVGTSMKTELGMTSVTKPGINNDNFDHDDYDGNAFSGTAVDRFALYDALTNVDWQGCVEARKTPYDTNDAAPDATIPDTLFTPEFAPDEPDTGGFGNSYISDTPAACTRTPPRYIWTQVRTKCDKAANNQSKYDSATCSGGTTTNTYTEVSELGVTTTVTSTRPSSIYNNPDPGASSYSDAYSYTTPGSGTYKYTITRVRTWTYNFSDRELQERVCKYTGAISTSKEGPNYDCPNNPITPLTNTKSVVNAAIDAMSPQGYTNIHQGAIWGLHLLSPTAPFTQGQAYNTATYKVMIVMTDGENTVQNYSTSKMNYATGYMAYGFPGPPVASGTPYNGRIYSTTNPTPDTDAKVTESMDARLVATCQSAKDAGITVYTIGLATQNTGNPAGSAQAKVEQMLKDCSSGTGFWYFPSSGDQLTSVFKEIASQLADLRLAK